MASKVKFFSPDATAFGTLADWELQSGANPSVSRQRAQALKADGDELAAVQYGARIALSANYVAKTTTGTTLSVPKAGTVSGGAHVDSVSVSYSQTGFPTLSVEGHRHATVAGVAASHETCRTYSPSIVLPPRTIGVPSSIKGLDGKPVFTKPDDVGMRSLNYRLAVTHVDEDDGDGNHLAAENRDGVETLEIEFTGEVDVSELAIADGWMLPESSSVSQSNTAATTTSVTLVHHVAMDSEAA